MFAGFIGLVAFLLAIVKQMLPWCYYPGIVIEGDDVNFHHSMAVVLHQREMVGNRIRCESFS